MKFFTAQLQGTLRVDRAAHRINGMAVACVGVANGDMFDLVTLQMLAQLGNTRNVRARFDHPIGAGPGEVEQTLSNLLGQHLNFRVEGDTLRADCVMKGVNVALEDKVLDLAERYPRLFGLSVVIDDPPANGKKVQPGEKSQPRNLLAADFVDLPASNRSGLFAKQFTEGSNAMDPADMYAKDGKLFCSMEGKEVELKHTPESLAASHEMWKAARKTEAEKPGAAAGDDDDDDDPETMAKKAKKLGFTLTPLTKIEPVQEKKTVEQADIDKAVATATAAAVEGERTYRKMFGTVLATAKLDAAAAAKFETDFYGRAEADLKFLATHAIGERAKPLGEGSERAEQKAATDAEKAAGEIKANCMKKFSAEPSWRRRFGVNTTNAADPAYVDGLNRFIAVETKCRADEAKPAEAKSRNLDEDGKDDPIGRVLKNKSMLTYVD